MQASKSHEVPALVSAPMPSLCLTAAESELPKLTPRLPALATEPVLIGHAKKADLVFTWEGFRDTCDLMGNGNPQNFFLMPYRDKTGKARFAKAHKARADHRTRWAFDTITGRAKTKASVGFYPRNADGKSRWAAMDFDAHDGEKSRARDLALKSFGLLLQHPELYLVLCTSGSDGWHLFVFTDAFHPVGEWARLLRNIADLVGSPVEKGVLEIFPDDSQRGIGNGIRAPGTWNPKSDEFGLIAFESISKLLAKSIRPKEEYVSLGTRSKQAQPHREGEKRLTYRESALVAGNALPSSEFYRGEHGEWASDFAIDAPRSRHEKLAKLVGKAFFQAGRATALENARLQHEEANPAPATPMLEHLAEFDDLWTGLERKWLADLSDSERRLFEGLSATERDAFRLMRNWNRAESADDDFKIVAKNLARRLGVSLPTACNIRSRFCTAGILRKTAEYVPHKLAARYQWAANRSPSRKDNEHF